MASHALNTAPFKSHTDLWHWQTSDRDSPIRFCWRSTHYNHTSWVIILSCIGTSLFCNVAVASLWLCSHRLVTLQAQTCDFAITGSVLQSWFKPNSWLIFTKKIYPKWSICIKVLLNHITLRSSQRVPLMSPCSPKIIGRVSLINQPPSPL